MTKTELKEFLDYKITQYETPEFIESDPISIPHRFSRKEDIEISGFFTALLAWGRRDMIIRKANELMVVFQDAPYDFVMDEESHLSPEVAEFKHRTFNGTDLEFLIRSMRNIYKTHGGLESIFVRNNNVYNGLVDLYNSIFEIEHEARTTKHIANPVKGSSAKRLNMFLRWMVRNPNNGVDFGLWKSIPSSILHCPLDVHSGNVARVLGLLNRKQNDWRAVVELTENLQKLDPKDPIKYDIALFGLGVFEGIK